MYRAAVFAMIMIAFGVHAEIRSIEQNPTVLESNLKQSDAVLYEMYVKSSYGFTEIVGDTWPFPRLEEIRPYFQTPRDAEQSRYILSALTAELNKDTPNWGVVYGALSTSTQGVRSQALAQSCKEILAGEVIVPAEFKKDIHMLAINNLFLNGKHSGSIDAAIDYILEALAKTTAYDDVNYYTSTVVISQLPIMLPPAEVKTIIRQIKRQIPTGLSGEFVAAFRQNLEDVLERIRLESRFGLEGNRRSI